MNARNRRGSALLIVLGMLSFMVVSAVGFSAYMRQSRVPSSHLRRETSARYLLKAALANAIDRLDGTFASEVEIWGMEDADATSATSGFIEGVYEDPYPGVGPSLNMSGSSNANKINQSNATARNENGDQWNCRVFTPFGPVSEDKTVSTLTLEALAYLPPAVVNDARILSRQTRTAVWKNLSYDLGRYAFCAIDVSDCFDLNKVDVEGRRTSAAGQRITFPCLLGDDASSLSSLLANIDDDEPLVSLADFNVVAQGSDFAPFTKYINTSGGRFQSNSDKRIDNSLFVTDTWFPPTNRAVAAANTHFDLSTSQPFDKSAFSSYKLLMELGSDTPMQEMLYRNIGGVGLASLFDYLDGNREPFSLAIPTVEEVPMICGVSLFGDLSLDFSTEEDTDKSCTYTRVDNKKQPWSINRKVYKTVFKGFKNPTGVMLKGLAMFPFKRTNMQKRESITFSADMKIAVFFANSSFDRCRVSSTALRPTSDNWTTTGPSENVFWYRVKDVPITLDLSKLDDAQVDTSDTLVEFQGTLSDDASGSMAICYKIDETATPESTDKGTVGELVPTPISNQYTIDSLGEKSEPVVIPFDDSGAETDDAWTKVVSDSKYSKTIKTGAELEAAFTGSGSDQNWTLPDVKFRPVIAVWMRVVSGKKTYDMAPATFKDDDEWLDTSYGDLATQTMFTKITGEDYPLLDFKATIDGVADLQYGEVIANLDGSQQTKLDGYQSLFAVDPRYNFAPEDWFGVAKEEATKNMWIDATSGVFGNNGRDHDVFMFTSDQEYLQSIGELQFLPYVMPMNGKGEIFMDGQDYSEDSESRYHGNANFASRSPSPSTIGSFANGVRMWKTYSACANDAVLERANPYSDLKLNNGQSVEVVSGSNDFRVNPFSTDERIIMSVVRNTPYDYYVASTNEDLNKIASAADSDPEKYAFAHNGKSTQWTDDMDSPDGTEVLEISQAIQNEFREAAQDGETDVTSILGGMDWNSGDESTLLGVELDDPLHSVDRKFLYSYWRECFQNRQQLFLVFLRAEPSTVGGSSSAGHSNSQLGARGVALVWRDPQASDRSDYTASMKNLSPTAGSRACSRAQWQEKLKYKAPHKTRVLFYHQFD